MTPTAKDARSLDGTWWFQMADSPGRMITVPSAWEADSPDKITDGPAIYERTIRLTAHWLRPRAADGRVTLVCDAISFYCKVWVNGHLVGEHTGMWHGFSLDVTRRLSPGENKIRIEVWKPGTTYPVRETLAGFLPDVATTFGGIWQSIRLIWQTPGPGQAGPVVRNANQPALMPHFRGILDWGWNSDRIAPGRTQAQVHTQIRQARALGFNLIKLCLVVPDDVAYEVYESEQMFVWLELPLWQPTVTTALTRLIRAEYEAILARCARFSCIRIISLGCELDAHVPSSLLHELAQLVRRYFPNVLLNDNSGSAEAYGGVRTGLGDFYDYHFYCDPHFFEPLLQKFSRGHDPRKPWIFGEFCDADTGRMMPPASLWWVADELANPRPELMAWRRAVRANDPALTADLARLLPIAHAQATAVRKFVLERVRLHYASGGYVVSGWQDTPITTSGIVDDGGRLKFSPKDWLQFNNDRVLVLTQPPARKWVAGGDRPEPGEPLCLWDDEQRTAQIVIANGGEPTQAQRVDYRWHLDGEPPVRAGVNRPMALASHAHTHLLEITLNAKTPTGSRRVRQATLAVRVRVSDESHARNQKAAAIPARRARAPIVNQWRFFVLPDRTMVLAGLAVGRWHDDTSVTTTRMDRICERIRGGAREVIWLQKDHACTRRLPFWREAIHERAPHDLWRALSLPERGGLDMRFFGIATDLALDTAVVRALLPVDAEVCEVWRRFDARLLTWHAYLIEARIGSGRLFFSTLRFAGGAGAQPDSFATNPLGAWMLAWLSGSQGATTIDHDE